MQKINEPLNQIEKHATADGNIHVLFQSENNGFSVLGCNKGVCGIERELPYRTLFFVLKGSLIIVDMEAYAWKVGKGEFILLPKQMSICLHIAPDTRYIDIKTDELVSPERDLCNFQVHNFDDFPQAQKKEVVNRTILAGSHSVFMTMLLSKEAGVAQYALPGKAMLFVMEGSGELLYKKQCHQIFEGQKRSLAKGGRFMIRANADLKVLLLITLV